MANDSVATSSSATPPHRSPMLRASNLFACFRRGFTLSIPEFQVGRGEAVALIGANGSGKSILIETLLGLRAIRSGVIEILGSKLPDFRKSARLRVDVGVQLQRSMFPPAYTVAELMRVHAMLYGPREEQIVAALGIPDLAHTRYEELSRGQRIRTHLCLACSHLPSLLFLDEPTSGLDSVFHQSFLEILDRYFISTGRSVVFATHDTKQALLAGRVVWMAGGAVQAEGSLEALLKRHTGAERLQVLFRNQDDQARFRGDVTRLPGVRSAMLSRGGGITVHTEMGIAQQVLEIASRYPLRSLHLDPVDLYDLFAAEQTA